MCAEWALLVPIAHTDPRPQFGYSSQLPQIVRHTAGEYFFTQKLSWNNINKFPHTTFYWAALDGSKVLTHFSPTDTYNAYCTVDEMLFSVSNNKDLAYTSEGLVLCELDVAST